MFRLTFLLSCILTVQLSFTQFNSNLVIELGQSQTINLRSMSIQDSLDMLINSDTILTIPVDKNNLFYIQNTDVKYYLYLTETSVQSTVVSISDSIHVSGFNSNFIIFLNEYMDLYQYKFNNQLLTSNYNSADELEIYLYNLINNEIDNFYNNHRYFDSFSKLNQDYFMTLLKYEYLSSISHFVFNIQKSKLNLNQDPIPMGLELANIKWLEWDVCMNSFNDTSFYELSTFQDYTFYTLFLFALNDYKPVISTINDFQNFSLYFLNFIYENTPFDLSFTYLEKMIQTFGSLVQKNTFDYITQFLFNHNVSDENIELLNIMFQNEYNKLIDVISDINNDLDISHNVYMEDQYGEISNLDKFIGKILYIDIWASWCGPCRKQFPYSKELKRSFSKRQQKKIKFLYLSIDNDYSKWKASIDKLNIQGEHFISPANKSNSAANYFQASSIPRYIIIDKNGKILNMNAKRPSDETLFEELLNLLD